MAAKRITKGNTELAQAITEWKNQNSVADDAYLSQVCNAINSGTDLNFWSQYDAIDLLPYPDKLGGAKETAIADLLITVRNILVFVPIAFTWAGISQATAAFSKYSEANPNKVVNFFDFWENGYDVLNPFWVLSNIALITSTLLTLIIVGSVGIAYLQKSARLLQRTTKNSVEQSRLNLALAMNKYLFDFRDVTPIILNQSLNGSIRDLRVASASLSKVMKSAEKNATELARGSVVRSQLDQLKKSIEKIIK